MASDLRVFQQLAIQRLIQGHFTVKTCTIGQMVFQLYLDQVVWQVVQVLIQMEMEYG